MSVLIVDDQPENLYLLETVLKSAGLTVQSAADGAAALEQVAAGGIELVISDILMPVMDGFELCRRLKADARYSSIAFIFYTATYTGCQDEEFARKLGADRFLLKPCEPDEMLAAVHAVLDAGPRPAAVSPAPPEPGILKLYNERLVCKLEQKMLQLEQEVKERQQIEVWLKASEVRYQRLFEAARDGVLILEAATGEIIDLNPALCELLGYGRDELLGREIWQILPFDEIKANQDAFAKLKREGYVRYDELSLHTNHGLLVNVEVVGSVYRDGQRDLIQCSLRDISARMEAEDALQTSETEYRQLFNGMRDAYISVDMQGFIKDYNQPFMDLLGYTASELGRLLYQEITPAKWQDREAAIVQEQVVVRGYSDIYEKEYCRKDGSSVPVELRTVLSRDAMGHPVGMWAIVRDITERKQIEDQRAGLEDQLRRSQKMEAIGSLAGGLAHDFNNLLSVIMGHVEFALMGLDGVGSRISLKDNLLQIQKASERAATLTRQLLSFSRKQVLKPIPLNLNQVVSGVEGMFRRVIGENIDLKLALDPELGLIEADCMHFEQLLLNLVVNARDAMPDGGRITIETANLALDEDFSASHMGVAPGPYVMLAVSDNGCGMDAATRDQIFEPFFTTKDPGKGTGLGLAMVYGSVKQSGGTIWVYSEPGQGTTFKLLLPRLFDAEQSLEQPLPVYRTYGGTETVLVVEDENALLQLVQAILEAAGYRVLTAADGAAALEISRGQTEPIDLVLSDMVMPGIRGTELVELLIKERPAIKVLYMSGYTGKALNHQGLLPEAAEIIGKPFNASDLMKKVRWVLDGRAPD